jgi:antirestriction protein ArdC
MWLLLPSILKYILCLPAGTVAHQAAYWPAHKAFSEQHLQRRQQQAGAAAANMACADAAATGTRVQAQPQQQMHSSLITSLIMSLRAALAIARHQSKGIGAFPWHFLMLVCARCMQQSCG